MTLSANAANAADAAIAVVIPTLNAGPVLSKLLRRLQQQTRPPAEILVIDSESDDGSAQRAAAAGARVLPIRRRDFNHGGTRNLGVRETTAGVVVFLTQDAMPVDEHFLEYLCAPLIHQRAAAAFARQIPHPWAWPPERFARSWNYPDQDEWRRQEDAARWGLRYVFFSNVASAVRRDRFLASGAFPEAVIMNEDVVTCARLLAAGESVAYLSKAVVEHSHNYSLAQQFRRYFDIGVFHARHHDLIPAVGTGGEGMRFVRGLLRYLLLNGHWGWIPRSLAETGMKFLGFHLGKREARLSLASKRRFSMHRGYWLARRPHESAHG